MKKTDIQAVVLNYIDTDNVSDDKNLYEVGLDSLKLINMILDIERNFNIVVKDNDLILDNFKSINSIYEMMLKYFRDDIMIKCIISDCDEVLWHGISGENGKDAAYMDEVSCSYIKVLADFKANGGLLALVSRNECKNILAMLSSDNIMLRKDSFISIHTECMDKRKAIADILEETGFQQDNVLYIDDSGFEITMITDKFNELHCIKKEPTNEFIQKLYEYLSLTRGPNDIDRTQQFHAQKEREAIHSRTCSTEEYNQLLETVTECRLANENDIERIEELSKRTNRFNTSGFRYDKYDVINLLKTKKVYVIIASDKYGDMGLVGAAVVDGCLIESFMLSCRVFGRNFEQLLMENILSSNHKIFRAIWNDTGNNSYCKNFFKSYGIKTITINNDIKSC